MTQEEATRIQPTGSASNVVDLANYRDARSGDQTAAGQALEFVQPPVAPPGRRRRSASTALDEAFSFIALSLDSSLDLVDRSNAFDSWLGTLQEVVSHGAMTGPQARVAGAMVVVTAKADVVHLSAVQLAALSSSTSALRKPAFSDEDANQQLRQLLSAEFPFSLPSALLGELTPEEAARADRLIALIEAMPDEP